MKKPWYNRILLLIFFPALLAICVCCNKASGNNNNPNPPADTVAFAKGADIGWLSQMESAGIKFYDNSGNQKDCIELLKSKGINSIRLRVWVNPTAGWCNAADVVKQAARAKKLGMRIMIDFHYSDWWADPGKQNKPAAWKDLSFTDLLTAVSAHTKDVLQQLKAAGVTPEWVQVGNETNDGMLWEDGRASKSMANFTQLVNAGYDGVKSIFPSAKVIVHLANGWDNSLFRWMFDGLKNNGGKFDVIGMSLYPTWAGTDWATANQNCLNNMNDMVGRYNKEVMIVEVGMAWDNAAACKNFLTDLITKAKSVAGKKCLGVLYWEPQSYNNWQGYTLGAFDNSGKPTAAMDAFKD